MCAQICNLWTGKTKTIDELFTIFRSFAAKQVKMVPDFLISKELLEIIAEELPFDKNLSSYDAIISTHHYSSSVIAAHKVKQNCNTLLIDVHTDYTPHPLIMHPLINFYTGAIPLEDAGSELNKRIVTTGIPVRKSFQYYGTPKEKKIMIMGGADGFGELEKMVEFVASINNIYEPTVICGRNTLSYKRLKRKFPKYQILGYVADLSEQFKTAEFVLTKASGLTVAEALNSECIPLFTPPILFWEYEASKYISAHGAGICLPDFGPNSIKTINAVFSSDDYKQALRQQIRQLAKPNATKDIVDLIEHKGRTETRSNPQEKMITEMKRYYEVFSSAQDLPKLAKYLTEQIEGWLRKHEPNNSS